MNKYKSLILAGLMGVVITLPTMADHRDRGHHRNHNRGGSGLYFSFGSNGFNFGSQPRYRATPRCVQYYTYDYYGRPRLVQNCYNWGGSNYYNPYGGYSPFSRGWY